METFAAHQLTLDVAQLALQVVRLSLVEQLLPTVICVEGFVIQVAQQQDHLDVLELVLQKPAVLNLLTDLSAVVIVMRDVLVLVDQVVEEAGAEGDLRVTQHAGAECTRSSFAILWIWNARAIHPRLDVV